MDERSLPAQRRFVAECAAMAVLALVWLACLVLGVGGPRATQAISSFGLIVAAAWTWYETVLGRDVPFPSVADVGSLAAVPLAAVKTAAATD
jgi:hypothetical protein